MFKFLHAADLHLDSPLRGLDRYDGAPVDAIRQATRRAVENLVTLAIDERVAFVLIAGDVYDGDWPDYNTGLFFARQMGKLRDAGIGVYLVRGNHDAQSKISRALTLPDNVYEFSTKSPETRIDEATDVAIHGQGFAQQAVTSDLSAKYPSADPGRFNIGLLHTSAGGYEGHERYAPCTVEGLCDRGYDYWALGHIHLRQTLCDNGSFVAFSGNTQGRHIRETGPKGCLLVTVDRGRATSEFRALDVFRWERCVADVAGLDHPDDVLAAVSDEVRRSAAEAEGRAVAVRIEVAGRCGAHAAIAADAERWEQEIRGFATRDAGEDVWVEKVRFATAPPSTFDDLLDDGPLAELRRLLAEVERDDTLLRELAGELSEVAKKLPREVRERLAPSGLDDPLWLRPLASDAGRLLLGKLTEGDR